MQSKPPETEAATAPLDGDLMHAPEMLDAIDGGLVFVDRDLRVIFCNDWFASASGIVSAEATGRRLDEILPGCGRASLTTAVTAALGGMASVLTHNVHGPIFDLRSRSGRPLTHDISIQPVGRRPYASCLIQVTDVTSAVERRRLLLDRQTARYDALVEGVPDSILTLDAKGVIGQANAAAVAVFGRQPEELVGRHARELFEDPGSWDDAWRLALAGQQAGSGQALTCRTSAGATARFEPSFARWEAPGRLFVTVFLRNIDERLASEAALRGLNERLRWEVTERALDIQRLEALQRTQAVLVAELQHRTRNLMSVVKSLAAQTIASSSSLESFGEQFTVRLAALSRVQNLLSRSNEQPITIGALVRLEIDALGADDSRVVLDGPEVRLRKSTVQTLALVVHELATNARKYGAFSTEEGRLSVTWGLRDGGSRLKLEWLEEGIRGAGADVPARRGYGRQLIEKALPYEIGAQTCFDLQPHTLRCTIELPV